MANLNVITSSSDYSDYAGHRPGVTAAMQIQGRYTVDSRYTVDIIYRPCGQLATAPSRSHRADQKLCKQTATIRGICIILHFNLLAETVKR